MIILTSTDKIQVKLGGNVAANQLECYAAYRDTTSTSITAGRNGIVTNNTTAVDVVGSPAASTQRVVDYLSVYNADTSAAVVTVQIDISSTTYSLVVFTLQTGEKLEYQEGLGFKCINIAGAIKESIEMGYNNITTGWSSTVITSDVINNNAVANTIQDVTGLSFAVTSGNTYWFRFVIPYTANAAGTGARWSINGPAVTALYYYSQYSAAATSLTVNEGLSTYDSPAAANNNSAGVSGNMAQIEGIIIPSANGTLIARFASEVANAAITAKAGAVVYYRQLN